MVLVVFSASVSAVDMEANYTFSDSTQSEIDVTDGCTVDNAGNDVLRCLSGEGFFTVNDFLNVSDCGGCNSTVEFDLNVTSAGDGQNILLFKGVNDSIQGSGRTLGLVGNVGNTIRANYVIASGAAQNTGLGIAMGSYKNRWRIITFADNHAEIWINQTTDLTADNWKLLLSWQRGINSPEGFIGNWTTIGSPTTTTAFTMDNLLHFNGTNKTLGGPAAPPGATNFDLTAKDLADSTALTNITIKIFNSSFSFNTSTVNGTIILINTSFNFGELYDIEFRINDSSGYFNRTFINKNITEGDSFEGSLFQSVLSLGAVDGLNNLTVNSFSAITNLTSLQSTTIGNILILTKAGTYELNVTADGFDKFVTSFTVSALQNLSLNVSLGSIFNFNLIREETNTVFDFNSTNRTKLNIFCPNQTIQIVFNVTANISRIINCQFTLMQIVIDYGDLGSYFRTLIPPFSQKNVTWYLIDLVAGDTAVQKIIQLLDLTGEFADSTMRIKRSVGGTIRTIIEQQFDISNQVNLFLVKDALYTISIENADEEIILGNLIPTEAGTQTITLPKIDFVPGETTLGGNISWDYTFNTSQTLLRMQYVDQTNLTTLVRWTIVNDATQSTVFEAESNSNSTVTMTFNQAFGNVSYLSELFIIHPDLSNITDRKVFYEFGGVPGTSALDLDGWTLAEQKDIKKWTAFIFLALWGLLFSKLHAGIGMTTMVIWLWLFRTWKWVDVDGRIFIFIALMAIVGWVVEMMRKN